MTGKFPLFISVKGLLFFQGFHYHKNLIIPSKMIQVCSAYDIMKFHRTSWNGQKPSDYFLFRKKFFVFLIYMIPYFPCKCQMFLCNFHLRQRHCTFYKQIRNSFFPVGLSQKNRSSAYRRIFRRDSTQIRISIIFYIDFLRTVYLPDLTYIIGNPKKTFIPFRLLFLLFIDYFYHNIHPFGFKNSTEELQILSDSGRCLLFFNDKNKQRIFRQKYGKERMDEKIWIRTLTLPFAI